MTTSLRIYPLPLHLANQIAAGEVIERPASVVKELVENSIDAGATQIDIDIEGAGSQLIRVRDNGSGIHRDDLALALSRHATSKLLTSEQLSHIASLGFRGEALPSITSVSQLTLFSRQTDSDCGWQINGNNNEITPTSHPLGTTIEVRDLFFNLPARRRFLRSNKTEQHHILTTLQRLALSRLDVGFNCQIAKANRLKLPAISSTESPQQRIAKICGQIFIDNALHIEQTFNDITLSGWLGKVSAHRAQTDVQYFFINGRVIRDRVINHAVRQAYADQIPAGRQPAYVLHLTLPLDRVDVNVHPTKHEVRFRDARLIHGLVTSALQEALSTGTARSNIPQAIAEQASHYQSERPATMVTTRSSKPTSALSPLKYEHANTILHQRYAIIYDDNQPALVDLQLLDRQLRQQSLLQAIQTNTLKSRPILVPVSLPLDNHIIAVANKHTAILCQLGIEFVAQPLSLTIKSIPSLLAQANIQSLVNAILSALSAGQTQIEQLSAVLEQQIPFSAINTLEQANQILQQTERASENRDWYRKLDQQTLSSLFSS